VNLVDKRELAAQTHQDVIDLVSFLKNTTEQRITSIQSDIVSTGSQWLRSSDTASSAAINLAFDFHFGMLALEEVGGFTIIGTSCLPNHLIEDERNRTLSLFSHSELLNL
jgi:hypothetical protein